MDFTKLFRRKEQVVVLANGAKGAPHLGGDTQSTASLSVPEPGKHGAIDGYLNAYADSAWVYACVSRKAQDAASLPLRLYRRKSGGADEEIITHPALALLASVNNGMTQYDFFEWLFSSLELAGNFYAHCVVKGTPNLFPFVPSMIEPTPDPDPVILIKNYIYHVNNSTRVLQPEEMLHVKYYSPLKSGYVLGLAPLTAARMAYETDNRALGWNLNKIKKGNSIEGVLTTENPYFNEKAHRDEALESWNAKYSGDSGAKTGVLFGGVKFENLGISPKDMEFLNQRKMTREELLSVFKVPPAVLGLFEYANYANAEQQEKYYWRNGIIPMLRKVEGSLTEKYLPKFGDTEGMYLKFDTSGVEVLQANEDAKSKVAQTYFAMGVPYNDLAEKLNLPVKGVPGGDVGYIPFSLMPAGAAAEPVAEPQPVKKPKLLSAKLTETQKQLKWESFVKVADVFEERMAKTVKRFFLDQEQDVITALENLKKLKKKIDIDAAMFDDDAENARLKKLFEPLQKQIIAQQAKLEIDNFNFGISFDLENPRVAEWISKRGLEASDSINKTTKEALRSTLSEGVSAGETIPQLAARVSETYMTATASRAKMIARTETIAASNEGALESYRQTGLKVKKAWLSANDERTRETHIQAGKEYDDDGAIPLDAPFIVGSGSGAGPGLIDDPAESVNCRCSVYPIIEE